MSNLKLSAITKVSNLVGKRSTASVEVQLLYVEDWFRFSCLDTCHSGVQLSFHEPPVLGLTHVLNVLLTASYRPVMGRCEGLHVPGICPLSAVCVPLT